MARHPHIENLGITVVFVGCLRANLVAASTPGAHIVRQANTATNTKGNGMLPQPAPPRRTLGTSGVHFVPPISPSLNPAILGQVAASDKVRQLGLNAVTIAQRQAEAARHGSMAIHGDLSIPAPERYRRAYDVSTAALMPAAHPLEKARRAIEKENR
jgi:hypothetical protein